MRDKGVLTVEDAVHKLTQVQADLFGFADRGVLQEGFAADLVVFDPATVAPGPLRRVRTSRPMPSASPPTNRRACATCWSTAPR